MGGVGIYDVQGVRVLDKGIETESVSYVAHVFQPEEDVLAEGLGLRCPERSILLSGRSFPGGEGARIQHRRGADDPRYRSFGGSGPCGALLKRSFSQRVFRLRHICLLQLFKGILFLLVLYGRHPFLQGEGILQTVPDALTDQHDHQGFVQEPGGGLRGMYVYVHHLVWQLHEKHVTRSRFGIIIHVYAVHGLRDHIGADVAAV